LFVRDLNSEKDRDFGVVCDASSGSRWSPDGRFLIADLYAEVPPRTFACPLALVSAETGTRVRQIGGGHLPAFSPNGRMIAYADGKSLKLQKLTSDQQPASSAVLVREPREIPNVVWTADGTQIVYQVWGDVPYLRHVAPASGSRPQSLPDVANKLSITQFLADGKALATETTQLEALWRADLSSTPLRVETVRDPDCSAGAPGCSADGRSRAFISAGSGISEIRMANGDGTNEHPLVRSIPAFVDPTDEGLPSLLGWSPDGKWIAFTVAPWHGNADVRTYLYVVPASGGLPRRLVKEAYALYGPVWSPDSKSLYAVQGWPVDDRAHDFKHPIVRVDVASGSLAVVGADGGGQRISPDGKFLYFFTFPRPKLSRIRISGGPVERQWDREDLYSAEVGERFLYLFQEPDRTAKRQIHKLIRFDPESRQSDTLAEIPFRPRFAYLSRDERFLYFQQQEDPKRRVVMVQGLF